MAFGTTKHKQNVFLKNLYFSAIAGPKTSQKGPKLTILLKIANNQRCQPLLVLHVSNICMQDVIYIYHSTYQNPFSRFSARKIVLSEQISVENGIFQSFSGFSIYLRNQCEIYGNLFFHLVQFRPYLSLGHTFEAFRDHIRTVKGEKVVKFG